MTSTARTQRHQTPAVIISLLMGLAGATLNAGEVGGGGGGASSIADREINRRMALFTQAQEAIEKGDRLMVDGDPEAALNEYRSALDILPEAPATQQMRDIALERYCKASVALAKLRAKNGRYADAKQILADSILRNPNCAAAKVLLKQLDDPERYEVALTPQHAKNVEDVQRELQMGVSYRNLGDYDKSIESFQKVLRIDKFNEAARKNMEEVERLKQAYYRVARDHTRATLLSDVDKGWETQVPVRFEAGEGVLINNTINSGAYLSQKMQKIIFPTVQFAQASIDEAIDFLRIKSKDLDPERDPTRRGVNIILAGTSANTITLDLRDVPMSEALRYITELAGMKYKVEPFAVRVVPIADIGNEQFTRTFKVPPDFISANSGDTAGAGGGAATAPVDPFAAKPGGAGAAVAGATPLPGRAQAIDILKAAGVGFPPEASAVFNAATSTLVVKNTQPNLDAVEAYVEQLLKKVPQQITISAKFVEVTQKNTDELGFDWLLGAFNIPGSQGLFGSGGVVGNSPGGPVKSTDFPIRLPGSGAPVGTNPLNRGSRSGSTAIIPDSIDGLLHATNTDSSVAPGVFSLSGVFTDPQFQVVIRALSQKKGVDLMSAPSVTTRSGQRASVEVVREFIYPTEFSPPQIPTNFGGGAVGNGGGGGVTSPAFPVTPTTPTAFTMRPVGVRMEVDPVIGPDGYTIDLTLAPEVVEFDGFINYGSPIQTFSTDALGNPTTIVLTENKINQPIFSTRKVQSSVTVWDGQTVAMGGLIREDVQDVSDKVPILGDLPLIGRLFQTKAEDHFKRNLVVFVTARLIDPSGQPIKQVREAAAAAATSGDTVSAVPGAPGLLPPAVGK